MASGGSRSVGSPGAAQQRLSEEVKEKDIPTYAMVFPLTVKFWYKSAAVLQ